MLLHFTVFNLEQTENVKQPTPEVLPDFNPIASAQTIVDAMPNPPTIKTGEPQRGGAAGLEENSAAYIQSWIQVLKNDKHLFVAAAGKANHSANYILNEQTEQQAEPLPIVARRLTAQLRTERDKHRNNG
jgi:antirestriction protein ArdC